MTCTLGVALVTALILNRKIIARGFFRAIFFYPVLLSPVVVGLVWQWFLNRNGLLNLVLSSLGGQPVTFLLEPSLARFWVVFVSVWFHVGFYTLILLAGLQAIPRDIYEAAAVDGTSRWRGFYILTLPLLAPNILVVVILLTINSVQIFDEAWVLTNGGGPGTANNFIVQYIYQTAFSSNASLYGLASAASVLMGLVLMILTALQFLLTRRLEGKKITGSQRHEDQHVSYPYPLSGADSHHRHHELGVVGGRYLVGVDSGDVGGDVIAENTGGNQPLPAQFSARGRQYRYAA
ncbi:hypothetical protein DZS_35680 [Dickeya ananatis]